MEKLKEKLHSCQRALSTLEEVVAMPFSVIVRDAAIQRFEYSFESLWKLLKIYLSQYEGLTCNSPKRCFREAFQVGLLSVEETELCLAMTDNRNLTSHTYIEAVAEAIYQKLPSYLAVMLVIPSKIERQIEPPVSPSGEHEQA